MTNKLLRIGSFVGVDMSLVGRRVVEGTGIEAGHNLGGNRLGFMDEITISPDYERMSERPILHLVAYGILGRWVEARLSHEPSDEFPEVTPEGAT